MSSEMCVRPIEQGHQIDAAMIDAFFVEDLLDDESDDENDTFPDASTQQPASVPLTVEVDHANESSFYQPGDGHTPTEEAYERGYWHREGDTLIYHGPSDESDR